MKKEKTLPWSFLDAWRGKAFKGQWPTLPEMFKISVERFGTRPCFTVFEPDKNTLTYAQVLQNVESPVDGILFTIREYPIVDEGSLIGRLLKKEVIAI